MSYDCGCVGGELASSGLRADKILLKQHRIMSGSSAGTLMNILAERDCSKCGGTGEVKAAEPRSDNTIYDSIAAMGGAVTAAIIREIAEAATTAPTDEQSLLVDELRELLAERDAEIRDMVGRHNAVRTALEGRLALTGSARDRYRVEAEKLADELQALFVHMAQIQADATPRREVTAEVDA
jgi:hypothetical protein